MHNSPAEMEHNLKALILALEADHVVLRSLLDDYSDYIDDDDDRVLDVAGPYRFRSDTFKWANRLLMEDAASRKTRKVRCKGSSSIPMETADSRPPNSSPIPVSSTFTHSPPVANTSETISTNLLTIDPAVLTAQKEQELLKHLESELDAVSRCGGTPTGGDSHCPPPSKHSTARTSPVSPASAPDVFSQTRSSHLQCDKCGMFITDGSAVKAEFSGGVFHSACFVCSNGCGAVLSRTPFVIGPDGNAYCASCTALKFSRFCNVCEKAILTAPLSVFEKFWHKECFDCHVCAAPLYGKPFFAGEGDKPECESCHIPTYGEDLMSTRTPTTFSPPTGDCACAKCGMNLQGMGISYLTALGAYWHQDCFTCHICPTSLVGAAFYCHDNRPFCEAHKFGE